MPVASATMPVVRVSRTTGPFTPCHPCVNVESSEGDGAGELIVRVEHDRTGGDVAGGGVPRHIEGDEHGSAGIQTVIAGTSFEGSIVAL